MYLISNGFPVPSPAKFYLLMLGADLCGPGTLGCALYHTMLGTDLCGPGFLGCALDHGDIIFSARYGVGVVLCSRVLRLTVGAIYGVGVVIVAATT